MKLKAIQMDPQLYYASRNLAFIKMMGGRNRDAEEYLNSFLDDLTPSAKLNTIQPSPICIIGTGNWIRHCPCAIRV